MVRTAFRMAVSVRPRISSESVSSDVISYSRARATRRDSIRPRAVTCAQRSPPVSSGVRTLRARIFNSVASGPPGGHELHDRYLEPFFEDLARLRRTDSAADVRRVRGARGEPEEIAIEEHRLRDADVGKVSGSHPRVIGDEDIAGCQRLRRELAQEVPHRARQGTDEGRDAVRRLGDGAAARIREHAREVMGSRTMVENEVRTRAAAASSAMEMSRVQRTSRLAGVERASAHALRGSAAGAGRSGAAGSVRIMTRFPSSSISNRPPGPTTAVDSRSSTIAGPGNLSPGRSM